MASVFCGGRRAEPGVSKGINEEAWFLWLGGGALWMGVELDIFERYSSQKNHIGQRGSCCKGANLPEGPSNVFIPKQVGHHSLLTGGKIYCFCCSSEKFLAKFVFSRQRVLDCNLSIIWQICKYDSGTSWAVNRITMGQPSRRWGLSYLFASLLLHSSFLLPGREAQGSSTVFWKLLRAEGGSISTWEGVCVWGRGELRVWLHRKES